MIEKWRISLNDYNRLYRIGVQEIRKAIFESLGQRYFEFQSLNELVFHTLRLIDETKFVQNNTRSLNKGMQVIRDYFDLPIPINDGKKADQKVLIQNFCHYLLYVKQLPYPFLREIKESVEIDLKEINKLVEFYESLPQIKNLLEGDAREAGKSHMILHFYGRCVEERKRILNYYLEGMYSEAKFRADTGVGWASHSIMLNRTFNPPYNFGSYFFRRNYDFRKIDEVSHRLHSSNIFTDEIEDYWELYETNKTAFYTKLFEVKKPSEIFKDIEYDINLLRLPDERKEIFKELERLFHAKEWLAFYAIALPQVEGLFAEMISLEKGEDSKNALSAKVRAVRSFSNSNERTFDYYEYILPQLRNLFAHGGLVGEYEIRAYDLLTDLEAVLNIFTNLENPFVEVSRLLKRKNVIDFPDLDSFATYLNMLDKITSKQLKELGEEIADFNGNFLINECQLESVSKQGLIDYKLNFEKISSNFSGKDGEFGLPALTFRGKIKSRITDLNKEYLQMTFLHSDNEIVEILAFDHLMQGIKKWIIETRVKPDFLTEQIMEWKNNSLIFHNLRELKNMLG